VDKGTHPHVRPSSLPGGSSDPPAAEERRGGPSRGVLAFLDVYGEGEEVEPFPRARAGGRRRQEHRLLVEVGDDRARGLLGETAGLEADPAFSEASDVQGFFGVSDL